MRTTADALEMVNNLASVPALQICDILIQMKPENASAWFIRGVACHQLNFPERAELCYRKAIALAPNFMPAHFNLGHVLTHKDLYEEAVRTYMRAQLLEDDPQICLNLGFALHCLRRDQEALLWFRKAWEHNPNEFLYSDNYGLAKLAVGDFDHDWCNSSMYNKHRFKIDTPIWKNEPLDNTHILLWADQGYGDSIQMIRYADIIKTRGGIVTLVCDVKLISLLNTNPGVARVVHWDGSVECLDDDYPEYQASIMALPGIMGTTPDTIPNHIPYLTPDPELVDQWADILAGPEFKIGVVWQGRHHPVYANRRSFPLDFMEPIAAIPNVKIYSLQTEYRSDWAMDVSFPLHHVGDVLRNFMDTAACMANLDLVIVPDTSSAHLAGALGKRTWVVLPYVTDWRWPYGRTDSDWYPTVKIFRQPARNDWRSVFTEVEQELRKFLT